MISACEWEWESIYTKLWEWEGHVYGLLGLGGIGRTKWYSRRPLQ